jgi:DNA-3-methyladenine glycosylase
VPKVPRATEAAAPEGVTPAGRVLGAGFFDRSAADVARALLGVVLVSTVGEGLTAGRIVETEAYLGPDDPASHAAERIGRTRRNDVMFGPPGVAYVYRIYGVHWCLNVVTGPEGFPSAVLIRAIEPVAGQDLMLRRRLRAGRPGRRLQGHLLAGGPGRLAQALAVTGSLNGHPLRRAPLLLLRDGPGPGAETIVTGPRIGVTRARDWPLRFHVRDNASVSR